MLTISDVSGKTPPVELNMLPPDTRDKYFSVLRTFNVPGDYRAWVSEVKMGLGRAVGKPEDVARYLPIASKITSCGLPVNGALQCPALAIFVVARETAAELKKLILAGLVGVMLVVCLCIAFYFMHQNPERAKEIFISFAQEEAQMLMKMLLELWDLFTDSWLLFHSVIPKPEVSHLVVPWVIFSRLLSSSRQSQCFSKQKFSYSSSASAGVLRAMC